MQSDKQRIEEEYLRLKRTHEAMRHEFKTLQEENASILDENQRLRRERNQLRSEDRDKYHTFMQKFQSPSLSDARRIYNDDNSKDQPRSQSSYKRKVSAEAARATSPIEDSLSNYNQHLLKSI